MTIRLENLLSEPWRELLATEFEREYFKKLQAFLVHQKLKSQAFYPDENEIFAAFNAVSPSQVKLIVLGQDPYHGPNQAHGLSFSVPISQALPPSLSNIYKELIDDLGIQPPAHGNLQSWADQGVLLLNSILTVSPGKAASHHNKGWEQFTDQVLMRLCEQYDSLVILLWGAYAQKKGEHINRDKHCVLEAPHPSPLSAYRGFFGCRHFSKANEYLAATGKRQIDWRIA